MGLVVYQLRDIKNISEKIPPGAEVLSLGYPRILANSKDMMQIFGAEFAAALTYGNGYSPTEPESYSFFNALGYNLTCIDHITRTGTEILIDLNDPVPEQYINKYDFIVDPGTIEHCFNIGTVMHNLVKMTKVDGCIYHCVPLLMLNHGYYNFSPRFFDEYFKLNGFEVAKIEALNWNVANGYTPIPGVDVRRRCTLQRATSPEAIQAVIVYKRQNRADLQFPTFTEAAR